MHISPDTVVRSLIYVADPMCSWCYGFGPVIGKLCDTLGPTSVSVRVYVGGLRPGTSIPWSVTLREKIRSNWCRVADVSGQPFDFSLFDDTTFVYDTEPACRAIVCMRSFNPASCLPYLIHLQHLFYAQGQDIRDPGQLAEAASAFVSPDLFRTRFEATDTCQETATDFEMTRQWGINGYPALILQEKSNQKDTLTLLTSGYQSYESLYPSLAPLFSGQYPNDPLHVDPCKTPTHLDQA